MEKFHTLIVFASQEMSTSGPLRRCKADRQSSSRPFFACHINNIFKNSSIKIAKLECGWVKCMDQIIKTIHAHANMNKLTSHLGDSGMKNKQKTWSTHGTNPGNIKHTYVKLGRFELYLSLIIFKIIIIS